LLLLVFGCPSDLVVYPAFLSPPFKCCLLCPYSCHPYFQADRSGRIPEFGCGFLRPIITPPLTRHPSSWLPHDFLPVFASVPTFPFRSKQLSAFPPLVGPSFFSFPFGGHLKWTGAPLPPHGIFPPPAGHPPPSARQVEEAIFFPPPPNPPREVYLYPSPPSSPPPPVRRLAVAIFLFFSSSFVCFFLSFGCSFSRPTGS